MRPDSAVNNQAALPAPITGATRLSGAAGTDSLRPSFAPGDTITVNGTPITFVASGATGNQVNVTDSVQTLLSKIDSITGTSTPSTINGGAITLHTDDAANLTVTSSNAAAIAALGFSAPMTASPAPLRVGGTPLGTATSLVAGTPANTVYWYTGNSGPGSARASATARIDQSITVQYGAQANEQAIRQQLQSIAVFAASTASPTGTNSAAQISALSERIATNLTSQPGQQTIAGHPDRFRQRAKHHAGASARQTQTQTQLQDMISNTETVRCEHGGERDPGAADQPAGVLSDHPMLSQLSLTKYLPLA